VREKRRRLRHKHPWMEGGERRKDVKTRETKEKRKTKDEKERG
jgi:hypothetical protein